jgi:hypothetical protein
MASKAERLRKLLQADQKTAGQTQASLLRVEDSLSALEDREARRNSRADVVRADAQRRMPATGGGRR